MKDSQKTNTVIITDDLTQEALLSAKISILHLVKSYSSTVSELIANAKAVEGYIYE